MTFPLANPWIDGVEVAAIDLYTNVTSPINALAAIQAAAGQGFLGSATGSPTAVLTTNGTYVAAILSSGASAGCSVTVTLATQRRLRVFVAAALQMLTGTAGHFYLRAAYTVGASVGTQVGIGTPLPQTITQTSSTNGESMEGDVLLAAGTYTFYPAYERTSGGGATDHYSDTAYTSVYDMGAV